VVSAIEAEIARLSRGGVSEAEMTRVKAGLRTHLYNALQKADYLAESLCEGQAIYRDPTHMETEAKEILDMPSEAPRKAARGYLRPSQAAVIFMLPKEGGESK
jgi:predicted Zn-dependent peptidase